MIHVEVSRFNGTLLRADLEKDTPVGKLMGLIEDQWSIPRSVQQLVRDTTVISKDDILKDICPEDQAKLLLMLILCPKAADPSSLFVDPDGNIVDGLEDVEKDAGQRLREFKRLCFNLSNPQGVDVKMQEYEGQENMTVVADPSSNDGGPCATVFGSKPVPLSGRWCWEVEVLVNGDWSLGVAWMASTGLASNNWPWGIAGLPRFVFPGEVPLPSLEALPAGSRIAVLFDATSSPPCIGCTLQGKSLGPFVKASDSMRSSNGELYPAIQLNWDDLTSLRVMPPSGVITADLKGSLSCYDLDVDSVVCPALMSEVVAAIVTNHSEAEIAAAGCNAIWNLPASSEDPENVVEPVRATGETLEGFAERVVKLVQESCS
ncbi:unnamed protein product [Polarella glacialis]|uniref:Ubiquitin-like domain-containing protein n=1 Tax=Polarella glacialis TaxID=89957 RepID=A0A813ETU0_POLGL|nr:unnamed protein product [Polarella glacialis]CAE8601703.1 unnamed protein product [Polarella glacialis]CAE8726543.1 unnamed protein product [Polarella glacialis]